MNVMRIWPCVLAVTLCVKSRAAEEWQPAEGRLMTRWASEVSPDNALPEYPRPQMVREQWLNLNGLWQYSVQASGGREAADSAHAPSEWTGDILVPFCIDSALSGVMQHVSPDQLLWYRRTFERPVDWDQPRTLLHFGAVDWQATVWVNGRKVGAHEGGYDPFTFDITDALNESGEQEVVVAVWDPTDAGTQPRGKQVRDPHGIWYTPVTGIWQTVWLEPVPETYVRSLQITPDIDHGLVHVAAETTGRTDSCTLKVIVQTGDFEVAEVEHDLESDFEVAIPDMKLWSPDSPELYNLSVVLNDPAGAGPAGAQDVITSYFAMRKISFAPDEHGVNRLCLNNEPLFQYGPLDQGWWPDGLYTAPTDKALRYDIEVTKNLGFNMARKHVKVEPARWYYWCDKLGLLVWQDMPSGDRHIRGDDPDINRTAESEEIFRREWQAIIEANRNHPCIVAWVPFNEGWGQFKTNEIIDWTKELDPTRLVDGPSGWTDRGAGDMHDMHRYPGPGMFPPTADRVSVLGEFGGLGLPLEGHTWLERGNWGYRSYESREDLNDAYEFRVRQLPWLIGDGLAAAIYTQTTDVEIEVNGLMTYDREVIKFDEERLRQLHVPLYGPPPDAQTLVPASEQQAQTWRYTTTEPGADWFASDFDDSSWESGPGGFGTEGTPGTHVRTTWDTPDIWLRRGFELQRGPQENAALYLRMHHDEDAQVYINGELAAEVTGFVTDYVTIPVGSAAAGTLRAESNTIAVHCRQTGGGQYIDVGIVTLVPPETE